MLQHMLQIAPKLSECVKHYADNAHYSEYGILPSGEPTGDQKTEEMMSDEGTYVEDTTTSEQLLQRFLRRLYSRRYDAALCKMAASRHFNVGNIEFSDHEDGCVIMKAVTEIADKYATDCPPPAQPSSTPDVTVAADPAADDPPMDDDALESPVLTPELTEETYQEQLNAWESAVAAHEKRAIETYLAVNAPLIVDDGADETRRKRRLAALPVTSEKRRKLIIKDYMCAQAVNWDTMRARHQSMFDPLKPHHR